MPTLCIQLGSFATLILNFVPAVEKALSLWIQSLMHLVVIQCFTSNNDVANIRSKLLSCDLRLDQYSFDRFCHPFAVYIKLPILWRIPIKKQSVQQSKWSYVGSTAVGVTETEEPSSNRCSMGSLFKLSLQFVFGQQRETIQSLPLLFYILFRLPTDRLGLQSMLL